jgi:hypothetical protein
MEKPKYKPEHMLMQAIGFMEDDLEANREGHISRRQRVILENDQTFRNTLITFAAILAIPLTLLFSCISFSEFGNTALFCFLIAGIIFFMRRSWARVNDDLRMGDVRAIEGWVKLDFANRGNWSLYSLAINGEIFSVKKSVFLAFKNGDPYRIYYAPHSKTILSAEWLRDEG